MTAPAVNELVDGLALRELPGPGDRVLWLHGYTLDATSWVDLWRRLPEWHHLGVDLPGHGASRPLRTTEDLPSLARMIGGAALTRGASHVVALSFGTLIALQIAMEHPGAFRSITLGAPALGGGPQDPEAERTYEMLHRLYRKDGLGAHLTTTWMEKPSPVFRHVNRESELWPKLVSLVSQHRWEELSGGSMQRLSGHPQAEPAIRRITAPILIVLGENDMPAFHRCGEIIRRSARAARRVYLEGAGHLCMLESPERAGAIIDSHLRDYARTNAVTH
jgi:pimeloyl-ACP methyl ester carboxylesterase